MPKIIYCKPFKRVRSIRKRFENTNHNLELRSFKRTLSNISYGLVKNRTKQFEQKRNVEKTYSNFTNISSDSNGSERILSPVNINNSFDKIYYYNQKANNYTSNFASSQLESANEQMSKLNSNTNTHHTCNEKLEKRKLPPKPWKESRSNTSHIPSKTKSSSYDTVTDAKYATTSSFDNNIHYINNEEFKNISIPGDAYKQNIDSGRSNLMLSNEALGEFESNASINEESENVWNHVNDSRRYNQQTKTDESNFASNKLKSSTELLKELKKNVLKTLSKTNANDYHEIDVEYAKPFYKETESQGMRQFHKDKLMYYTINNNNSILENEETLDNKINILDFIRRYGESFESEDDIFGSHLNVERDFCVQAFNNGNENTLFKFGIYRDLLTEYYEDDVVSVNDGIHYKENYDSQNECEKSRYYSIGKATTKSEAELRTVDCTHDLDTFSIKNSKIFHEEQEFQEDQVDGGDVWRNSSHFIASIEKYNVIKELIDTEETYLKNMLHIIVNYLQYFRRDPNISSDIEIVFGNIERIYMETKKICSCLKECTSVEEIAMVFLSNADIFQLYIEYMRNKSKSYQYATKAFSKLFKQRQTELNDQHPCEDFLVNPVQRLTRYRLLLQKLSEAISKAKETSNKLLDEAIALIEKKISEGNTMMAIDSICYCPVNLNRWKRFLRKNTFHINSKYNSTLFLFEEGVVFCKEDQDNIDKFDFLECISLEKLSLNHCKNSLNFQLGLYDKSKKYSSGNQYEFDIESSSMSVKQNWVDDIERLMWRQLQYIKDLQRASRNYEGTFCEGTLITEEEKFPVKDIIHEKCNDKSGTYFDKDKDSRIEITLHSEDVYENFHEGTLMKEEGHLAADSNVSEKHGEINITKAENPKTEIMDKFSEAKSFYIFNISEGQSNVIQEIMKHERIHLEHMEEIINNNKSNSENANFCPYIYILIQNIKAIYHQAAEMYSKLCKCETIYNFARIFLDNVPIFDLYIDYMWNKSTFCRYAICKKMELYDQDTFENYLVNAVVRLRKYETQLGTLDSELRKTGDLCPTLKDVITILNDKMAKLNRLLTINSIQRCPVNLEEKGSFIMQDLFQMKSSCENMIFLFDDIIVLTKKDGILNDTYIYFDSIEMSRLSIKSVDPKSLKLRTKDNKSETNKKKYDIEAESNQKRDIWKNKIEKLLKNH